MDLIDQPALRTRDDARTTERRENVVQARALVRHFRREDQSIVKAIDHVDLDVHPGEFVVLLGPSGCGKTTLLRCIAGLEKPDSGTIEIKGRRVFDSGANVTVPPERRSISMIFQSYALWPHMSAFDNVAYPLQSRSVPKADIASRVQGALKLVGIPELERQFPAQMSGGQQQRVALARAIVSNDQLVLFDEPLSNVDAKVREQLRIELLEMQRKLGFSALYVTHDQAEAMALAHRIAVIRQGKIVQIGSPREVYEEPLTQYVARFVGTTNEIIGKVLTAANGKARVSTSLGELDAVAATSFKTGDEVAVVIRPERMLLSDAEPTGSMRWKGRIEAALFLGAHAEHVARVGERTFLEWGVGGSLRETGTPVWLSVAPEHVRAVAIDQ